MRQLQKGWRMFQSTPDLINRENILVEYLAGQR